ncbi:MAG: serine/threonine-protein kinase [Gemmataceae bacterium]
MERVGEYVLMELIGKGGMGAVHRGYHRDTGRVAAVKIMAAELTGQPTLRRRFEQECEAAARLRHPNIVEGYAFGVEDDRPYLVMEYVDGPNLSDFVRARGPLPESAAARVAAQIGSALDAAHQASLIHRDVKPENVLLAPGGVAKLTDLGLVKDLESEGQLTHSGAWIGTIAYMAPEQFGDAKNVDGRTDVYGLAATLYFAVTGKSPFPDKGNMTVLGKKLRNDFVAPRALIPTLSEVVNAAICLGLDAKPELRPATCAEFVTMLTAAGDQPAQTVVLPDPEEAERRVARRFPTNLEAECSPLRGGGQRWEAEIRDVSLTGVLVRLVRRYQPGAVLELRVPDGGGGSSVFLMRVCWARPSGAWWDHGCSFGRALSEEDLAVFLKNKSTTRYEGGNRP